MKICSPKSYRVDREFNIEVAFLATAVSLLAACTQHLTGLPGQVTLTYSGKSETEFFFALENRTPQAIRLSASEGFWWSRVVPEGAYLDCTADDSSNEGSIGPYSTNREIITVPSERRIELRVERRDYGAPRFRNGPCEFTVTLENDMEIRSNKFKP